MNTILYSQAKRCLSFSNVGFAVISIFIVMFLFSARVAAIEQETGTRFIVIGHLYPLMDDLPHMEEIYNRITVKHDYRNRDKKICR